MFQQATTIIGGLALFVFGMNLMSDGLRHSAGDNMRSILKLFSANHLIAVVSGAIVTCVIQSSSATTIMVIGFINAGLLTLEQAIGIIFGANIGTTITAQLVAFKINWLVMPALIIGVILWFQKRKALSYWGMTIIGFAFLFLGLEYMGTQLKLLSEHEAFMSALKYFDCRPQDGIMPMGATLGAIAVGTLVTVIIQSSSASTGVVIVMATSGLLNLHTSIALILGANIGTTVTAQLAALSANRMAKQAALAHTLFNGLGVLLTFISFYIPFHGESIFLCAVKAISGSGEIGRQIANAHTLFNIATTLILFPFIPLFARICEILIPTRKDSITYIPLEKKLLDTPAIALAQTTSTLKSMLDKAFGMVAAELDSYDHNDEENKKALAELDSREEEVDAQQRDIAQYLTLLMQKTLSPAQTGRIPALLHCSNDAERIGDHATIIRNIMAQLKGRRFSDAASSEFDGLVQQLRKHHKRVSHLLEEHSRQDIEEAVACRNKFYQELDASERTHIARMSNGECKPEIGLIFIELLAELRKIIRHLSNITDRASNFQTK